LARQIAENSGVDGVAGVLLLTEATLTEMPEPTRRTHLACVVARAGEPAQPSQPRP
jgi:hypothetical protein